MMRTHEYPGVGVGSIVATAVESDSEVVSTEKLARVLNALGGRVLCAAKGRPPVEAAAKPRAAQRNLITRS